jgi:exopolyphosphatase/pppGpp-phosphohydrolase
MKQVAKGDVQSLCIHTRSLLDQLQAAGETTMDLLTNLMEALKLAPNSDFQRWLKTRIDMWSTKQIDWKPDGSDLMEGRAILHGIENNQELGHSGKSSEIYALQATEEYEEVTNTDLANEQADKENDTATAMQILALATQFKKQQKQKWEKTK